MKLEDYMSYTLTEDGKPLTETQHGMDAHSEDLQALCLGMATRAQHMSFNAGDKRGAERSALNEMLCRSRRRRCL